MKNSLSLVGRDRCEDQGDMEGAASLPGKRGGSILKRCPSPASDQVFALQRLSISLRRGSMAPLAGPLDHESPIASSRINRVSIIPRGTGVWENGVDRSTVFITGTLPRWGGDRSLPAPIINPVKTRRYAFEMESAASRPNQPSASRFEGLSTINDVFHRFPWSQLVLWQVR